MAEVAEVLLVISVVLPQVSVLFRGLHDCLFYQPRPLHSALRSEGAGAPGALGLYWALVLHHHFFLNIPTVRADKCVSLPPNNNWKYYWD